MGNVPARSSDMNSIPAAEDFLQAADQIFSHEGGVPFEISTASACAGGTKNSYKGSNGDIEDADDSSDSNEYITSQSISDRSDSNGKETEKSEGNTDDMQSKSTETTQCSPDNSVLRDSTACTSHHYSVGGSRVTVSRRTLQHQRHTNRSHEHQRPSIASYFAKALNLHRFGTSSEKKDECDDLPPSVYVVQHDRGNQGVKTDSFMSSSVEQASGERSPSQTVPVPNHRRRHSSDDGSGYPLDPDRLEEDEQHLQRIYDMRTWDMYLLITESRRRKQEQQRRLQQSQPRRHSGSSSIPHASRDGAGGSTVGVAAGQVAASQESSYGFFYEDNTVVPQHHDPVFRGHAATNAWYPIAATNAVKTSASTATARNTSQLSAGDHEMIFGDLE